MKRILLCTFELSVLAMVAFAPISAMAGSGAGPYYSTPSWDEKLACTTKTNCPRFEVLSNWSGEAVLDKETGLVWELSPSTSEYTWEEAQLNCNILTTGGRFGWRLPTVQEFGALLATTQSNPPLPEGHPFLNVAVGLYWSATSTATDTSEAWGWYIGSDFISLYQGYLKTNSAYYWCVRGGKGVDPQ